MLQITCTKIDQVGGNSALNTNINKIYLINIYFFFTYVQSNISLYKTHYVQLLLINSTYNAQKIICGGLQHPIEREGLVSVGSAKNWISLDFLLLLKIDMKWFVNAFP